VTNHRRTVVTPSRIPERKTKDRIGRALTAVAPGEVKSGARRDGRAVDGGGLENRCALTGTGGSNPSPSAMRAFRRAWAKRAGFRHAAAHDSPLAASGLESPPTFAKRSLRLRLRLVTHHDVVEPHGVRAARCRRVRQPDHQRINRVRRVRIRDGHEAPERVPLLACH
jgi:hypothetical protein